MTDQPGSPAYLSQEVTTADAVTSLSVAARGEPNPLLRPQEEPIPMDLSPTLELPLLDDRCTHPRCHDAEKGDAYRMVAMCVNCSTQVVLLLTSGHDFPSYSSGPKCPACGVRRWSKIGLEDQQVSDAVT